MIIEAKIGDNWQISKFANLKLVLCELWKGSIGNKKGAVRKVFSSTTSASPPFRRKSASWRSGVCVKGGC